MHCSHAQKDLLLPCWLGLKAPQPAAQDSIETSGPGGTLMATGSLGRLAWILPPLPFVASNSSDLESWGHMSH